MNGDRPYRLWDCSKKAFIPRRCYKYSRRAHWGAYETVRWDKKVGEAVEIINVETSKMICQYTRKATTISWRS